jgi:hypothetical protein
MQGKYDALKEQYSEVLAGLRGVTVCFFFFASLLGSPPVE